MEKCTKNNVLKRLTTVMVFLRTCFYKVIKIYSFRMREETKINTDQFTWGSLKRRWQVSALLRMFANTNREKPKAVSLKMGGQGPRSSFLYSDPPINSRKPPAPEAPSSRGRSPSHPTGFRSAPQAQPPTFSFLLTCGDPWPRKFGSKQFTKNMYTPALC